ncbi:hypothetical protein Dimus_014886 [Dionaea muscipula]
MVMLLLYGRMSRLPRGGGVMKRKRGDSGGDLRKEEDVVYNLIRSKGDMGTWKADLKRELKCIPARVVDNCIKKLNAIGKIKEVVNVHCKSKSRLMAMDIEPSTKLTGGVWYDNEGKLDKALIKSLNRVCLEHIRVSSTSSAGEIYSFIKVKQAFNIEVSLEQINEVLNSMVLDNLIIEQKSTGFGEFAKIPIETLCYKINTSISEQGPTGAMALIPCGVCPQINHCTPDGVISPVTCPYFTKWLDF